MDKKYGKMRGSEGIVDRSMRDASELRIWKILLVILPIILILILAPLFILWHPVLEEKAYHYYVEIIPEKEGEKYTIFVPIPVNSTGKPLDENEKISVKSGNIRFSEFFLGGNYLLKIEGQGAAVLEANTSWSSIKISEKGIIMASLSTLNETKDPYFNKTVYKYTVISNHTGRIHLKIKLQIQLTKYSPIGIPVEGSLLLSKIDGYVSCGHNLLEGTYENRCVSFP